MDRADLVVFGTVALADAVLPDAYVAISGEKVSSLGRREDAPDAARTIDVPGSFVLPGLIDGHVHSLGSPIEGFVNTTTAAVAGGVTTIVDMASDLAWPSTELDVRFSPESIDRKVAMGEQQTLCDFALWGGVMPQTLPDIGRMADTGVVGFKLFMADSRRSGRMDDGALLEAFGRIAEMDLIAAVHAENAEITRHLIAKYTAAGQVSSRYHTLSRPPIVELDAVSRALLFAEETGVHLHVVHTSLPEAVQLARRKSLEGVRVTVETCPHYLLLPEDTIERMGSIAKIMPALRTPEKLEAMWDLIAAGWIDIVGTDHSGHALALKQGQNVFDHHAGMPGVQTLLPLMFSEGVVKRGLSLQWLVGMVSTNPARLFRLHPRKGALLPGSDADLVVLDPTARWTIRAAELLQGAGYTGYEGWEVTGKPVVTVSRGEVVYKDGAVVAQPGRGRFIPVGRIGERKGAFAPSGLQRKAESAPRALAGVSS